MHDHDFWSRIKKPLVIPNIVCERKTLDYFAMDREKYRKHATKRDVLYSYLLAYQVTTVWEYSAIIQENRFWLSIILLPY